MTQPNPQTELLQKDIEYLARNVQTMTNVTDKRFEAVATEQLHQWTEIKELGKTMTDMRLTLKGIGMTAALYSSIGSSIASAVVVYLVIRLIG